MKVALIHDWLIHMRGGEKVLESFAELYPDATIYTLIYDKTKLSPSLQRMKVEASVLNELPGIKNYYRFLLPILPWAIKRFKLPGDTDLVLSSSHCVAKAITVPCKARHFCYCHTPMRYLWGFEKEYFPNVPFFLKPLLSLLKNGLRKFDLNSNRSVNTFIANSENVKTRIADYYGREAVVCYPPLDTSLFNQEIPKSDKKTAESEYYLVVSAFVPYKRVDLVIEAFNRLDRRLLVVGSGPMEKHYLNLRKNGKIAFLGSVPNAELRRLYTGARALVFPTEEDFGIVPLEAQACGTPVIAYGKGGALETVQDGVFFEAQTPESLIEAIKKFEGLQPDRTQIADAVRNFGKERFKREIQSIIGNTLR
jgi:glycosyltransferase involved in cell wall biosynthesis